MRPPVGQIEGKKQAVEQMFDTIAPRYDLLNRVLSLGIDQGWRKRVVALLSADKPQKILDVATGTADLALASMRLQPEHIIGVDIAEGMLEVGRKKIATLDLSDKITLQRGDSENLPFEDNRFDAVTVAFGVRNFENLYAGLAEMRRVLRPGGKLVVLEFSKPSHFPIKQLYSFYFRQVLPRVGSTVSGVSGPYQYLNESAMAFPDGKDFMVELTKAGYHTVTAEPQTFGIATIYTAIK
ncbi:MAG: bifunctional demethylmenaquinone methyltransferase/2-methoxy-6-polyprenyl-1,4-benzoquinol methylase UbiE [Bacteroidetes Order II. Incertae sedis bacterium]|nr:bifunctional demethylmenaquinone methyltransferase/2-methoxy-6-polyprenyl-1,4-benzoquinol methylase UbiE [Bacteroidetes Order II. bacterium]